MMGLGSRSSCYSVVVATFTKLMLHTKYETVELVLAVPMNRCIGHTSKTECKVCDKDFLRRTAVRKTPRPTGLDLRLQTSTSNPS